MQRFLYIYPFGERYFFFVEKYLGKCLKMLKIHLTFYFTDLLNREWELHLPEGFGAHTRK